jgi:tRNA pseudouridine55 synthase
MNAVLVVDKPAGPTSHDVVARVRRLAGERSVGHLGTLDPDATGVLPLLLGRFTRLAQFYTGSEKQYQGEIRLGFATDTYDASGEPLGAAVPVNARLEEVRTAAARFRGEIEQMPPPFSAKKIAGVPAYKLARSKREVPLQPVRVTIHELEVESVAGDRVRFRARVSAGTYLRSFAHDLGIVLGTGAHLALLRRTAVGEFTAQEARSFDQLEQAAAAGSLAELGVHPRRVLPQMPAVSAGDEAAGFIRHGRAVNLPEFSHAPLVKVFHAQGELIAIAGRIAGTLFQPKIVLMGE